MNDRQAVAWLYRRAGFGLTAAELDVAVGLGPSAALDSLMGHVPGADPWSDDLLPLDPKDPPSRQYAMATWFDHMSSTPTPLVDRMTWLWHGHFVSSFDKVKVGRLLVNQLRLFRSAGLGSFRDLLRSVTIDPAMMIYLDLRDSVVGAPNENYARELMELFTLGEGAYTEADVQAVASALTGWRLQDWSAEFQPRRHDPSPQNVLGVSGVNDLDSVIAAVCDHPALPRFVAGVIAAELLGVDNDEVVAPLADTFVSSELNVGALVRATLEAGLAGATAPVVVAPVPWLATLLRTTGARLSRRDLFQALRAAGQLPLFPPNVAGWPGGAAWFASGSLVARMNVASLVAAAIPVESPLPALVDQGALDEVAAALMVPSGSFADSTIAALRDAGTVTERLALLFASPDLLVC